jgi:hypothetical protein
MAPHIAGGADMRAFSAVIGVGEASFRARVLFHPHFRSDFIQYVENFRGQGYAALFEESLFQNAYG